MYLYILCNVIIIYVKILQLIENMEWTKVKKGGFLADLADFSNFENPLKEPSLGAYKVVIKALFTEFVIQ